MAAAKGELKKTGYHHSDLPNALMQTALEIMVERNGPNFSLRELARAVGVTHPSVYRHFKDKSELLDALMARGFDELRRYQDEEQARAEKTPIDQLYALCRSYVRFARENNGFFALMFDSREAQDKEANQRNRFNSEALSVLFEAIERCQQAGDIIPGDPGRMAGYLILAPHGLASYTANRLDFDHAEGNALELMEAEDLARVAVFPLLCNPPDPRTMSALFMKPARV